jgi:flagellin
LRINSAKDDAAGLAIADRFTSQINGTNQAVLNANNGTSLAQVTDGALSSASSMLQRIRQLAVESANATNSASDRQSLNQEVSQLVSQLGSIASTTQFNGQNLLDGTFGTAQFQVGANAGQTIVATTANITTSVYGNNQAIGSGAAANSTTTPGNGVTAGTIAINGSLGSKNITVASSASAKSLVAAINLQTSNTGVSATANTTLDLSFQNAGSYSFNLTSANATAQSITFSISATTGTSGLSSAVNAINQQSSKTGVTASMDAAGTGIVLTNSDGSDIQLASANSVGNAGTMTIQKTYVDTAGASQNAGATATITATTSGGTVTTGGYIELDSSNGFAATATTTNAFTTGNSTLQAVSSLDVSTLSGANAALKTVDAALQYIDSARANLGALESRFATTVDNLQTSSVNLSASLSGIQDADFAAETSALSRAQILQQAGTAMVAQANQIPQGVLSLLKQ